MKISDQATSILEQAKQCLEIEAETIHNLKNHIGSVFADAVIRTFQIKGRIVVTGIGKSAIVGQKIVATLNSTGSPSLFMHAADAVHGDLGMLQPDDILICLSKSGESPEIKYLLPLVKHRGIEIIAISSNADSYLAKMSDFLLLTPVSIEADPNNLAPTASTTAQMAIGDAFAVSLLFLRGFNSDDFAKFHPGGNLGKQLYLKVSDVYPDNKIPMVRENDPLKKVLIEISSGRMGAAAVLSADESLVGIITDGDLRRFFEKAVSLDNIRATHLVSRNPKCIDAHELAVSAFKLMNDYSVSQLIVTENGKYVGMIHLHDLLREGIF